MWKYETQGIPDDMFIRGEVPMTKAEVRAVTLSKLEISKQDTILDIGCGTGSVTIEMALKATDGKIIGLDQNEEAVSLTNLNAKRFECDNIETILGSAPDALPKDKMFDRIFVGGASKCIKEIVDYAEQHLNENGRFVANTILLKSTMEIIEALEGKFIDIECIQVGITRTNPNLKYMMKAMNPIYIISGRMNKGE